LCCQDVYPSEAGPPKWTSRGGRNEIYPPGRTNLIGPVWGSDQNSASAITTITRLISLGALRATDRWAPGRSYILGAWARPLTKTPKCILRLVLGRALQHLSQAIQSPDNGLEMAQAAFVEDILPPEGVYESRESLLTAINS
jgi:hypothetical protein